MPIGSPGKNCKSFSEIKKGTQSIERLGQQDLMKEVNDNFHTSLLKLLAHTCDPLLSQKMEGKGWIVRG